MAHKLSYVDSHTGGEPTRVVLSGFPDLPGATLAEARAALANDFDAWRRAVTCEPRGHPVLVSALLLPPRAPDCAAGVIYFNNAGVLGMCGHGTIGLVATLAHLGRLGAGRHRLDTPVGVVEAELHPDGRVSVQNVPAYRHLKGVQVEVPGFGPLRGDVAWGGNWFFLMGEHGQRLELDNLPALADFTARVERALAAAGVTGADGAPIDHVELFGPSGTANSKNYVMCPGGAYDRSPCGTGTSAKLACLAADGLLAPGQVWTQQSIIGSRFEASYVPRDDGRVTPTITGQAYVTAAGELIVNEADPFAWGIGTA